MGFSGTDLRFPDLRDFLIHGARIGARSRRIYWTEPSYQLALGGVGNAYHVGTDTCVGDLFPSGDLQSRHAEMESRASESHDRRRQIQIQTRN